MASIIGFLAGVFCIGSRCPQIVKAMKTRSTTDISLGMYVVNSSALSLWIVYGFLTSALPVIASSSIAFILVTTILILKLIYK